MDLEHCQNQITVLFVSKQCAPAMLKYCFNAKGIRDTKNVLLLIIVTDRITSICVLLDVKKQKDDDER